MLEYDRDTIEKALFDQGWHIVHEEDDLAEYTTDFYPGGDIIIDWSRDTYAWDDLAAQLRDCGLDPNVVFRAL